MNKRFLYLLTFIFLLSCEDNIPARDNPLDDKSEDYIAPIINLLTDIADGDTLFSESFLLEYEGNELVSEFRYKLDNFDWIEWNEDASVLLDYLDEGAHQIYAQSRYLNGDTSNILNINFIVDAVSGPALMFSPRRHFAEQNRSVTFQILAEEVSNLMASEIHLSYDITKIQIVSVSQGSILENRDNIFIVDYYPHETATNIGFIKINTTLLDEDFSYLNGTGSIVDLTIKPLNYESWYNNSSIISFNNNDVFIDPDNNEINIIEKVNGILIGE